MINLMYVVLMAMLALNVSTEVLDAFTVVEDSIVRTTAGATKENSAIYDSFDQQMRDNPQKVKEWFDKAEAVKNSAAHLYGLAAQLKVMIAREADGPEGDPRALKNKDDLEAPARIMLAPGTGRGAQLYREINAFREKMLSMIADPEQRKTIETTLTTAIPRGKNPLGKNWQEYMFEGTPTAAAITLLSKLQSDVRHAEGEVLHTLVANIDVKDIRVNKLSAFVIPESRTVISGDVFTAQIVMAAVDTTQQPEIYVGGTRVAGGTYRFTAGAVGEHQFGGYITMRNGSGETLRREFTQKYTVVGPSATVSADLMNVLYAGYDNPVSISIPGVPLGSVSATMSAGAFRPAGPGRYVARPAAVGQDVTINVAANQNGRARPMGTYTFHVRKLPDPTAYILFGTDRFRSGALPKAQLVAAEEVKAAIDDGILDVPFRVVSFESVFFDQMGNAVPIASDGAKFSPRQKEQFRKLSRGRRFYISHVTAVGPDNITRKLPGAMEVIVK